MSWPGDGKRPEVIVAAMAEVVVLVAVFVVRFVLELFVAELVVVVHLVISLMTLSLSRYAMALRMTRSFIAQPKMEHVGLK